MEDFCNDSDEEKIGNSEQLRSPVRISQPYVDQDAISPQMINETNLSQPAFQEVSKQNLSHGKERAHLSDDFEDDDDFVNDERTCEPIN